MVRKTRQQIALVVILLMLAGSRLLLETDPFYKAVQTITLPIAEKIYPASIMQADEAVLNDTQLTIANQAVKELRAQLELPDSVLESVTADVIKRDIGGFRKSIWANRGESDGVVSNQAVIANGFLIGKVISVSANWCEIQLINDPLFRASARANGNMGIITSQAGSLVYDLVPAAGLEDSPVVSDGIDGIFPPGLPIGLLDSDISDSTAVFKTYSVRLGNNPADVKYVSIIRGE